MAGKRWTRKEDEFLFEHFDGMGDFIGVHDLGRKPGAATARVKHLRQCGAWDALQRERNARNDYQRCLLRSCLRSVA